MQYFLDNLKKDLAGKINKIIGEEKISASDIATPPKPEMGDLSLPCFKLAVNTSPVAYAVELKNKFTPDKNISAISADGPYLNFTLGDEAKKKIFKEIFKAQENYGQLELPKAKRTMIEYSNGNTHKEVHIGHLRNIAYGDSVNKILVKNGLTVIPVSYINDFGINVAKTLWYLKKNNSEKLPDNKGQFLGEMYASSVKALENNEAGKEEVSQVMKNIESRNGEDFELWKKTRDWSIEQLENVYKELNIKFQDHFYESDLIEEGKKIVAKMEKDGILKQSQGALIADLESEGLGVLVVIRSDGTALYPVADLPLAIKKIEKYNLDESICVVDIRQSFYFKQLFNLLKKIGYNQNFVHLGYEFVKLTTGMMSSRSGNIITYEELKNEMIKTAEEETRKRHEDWNEERIKIGARKLAYGAMKFEMLKAGPDAVITFDTKEALKFDGFTAGYLQYTCARLSSVLKKAPFILFTDLAMLKETAEKKIILKLAQYPEAIKKAGEKYNPSEIAKYTFELAQMINDYYHSFPILKAPKNIRNARLKLAKASLLVLNNSLGLLGIEAPEEM